MRWVRPEIARSVGASAVARSHHVGVYGARRPLSREDAGGGGAPKLEEGWTLKQKLT